MNQTQDNSRHHQVFLLTLMGLLILRIPFEASMRLFNIEWEWTVPIYQIGTYLLTAFLLWWELDNLAEYHIDTLAVIIIVLFKPIQTLMAMLGNFGKYFLAFPGFPSLMIWIIAIVFAVGIWQKRSKLPSIKSRDIGWLLIGITAGLLTMIVLSYPMSFQVSLVASLSVKQVLGQIPSSFIHLIGYAAVSEEPLFRGFLWGYLRKLKWREVWIWLFQAGLFTLSHIYYINKNPISFWIIVPICSLVLGWLVWRSRTIASSMAAHGMMDATGYAFGYLVAMLRLG